VESEIELRFALRGPLSEIFTSCFRHQEVGRISETGPRRAKRSSISVSTGLPSRLYMYLEPPCPKLPPGDKNGKYTGSKQDVGRISETGPRRVKRSSILDSTGLPSSLNMYLELLWPKLPPGGENRK
jgi:hypothetical protein